MFGLKLHTRGGIAPHRIRPAQRPSHRGGRLSLIEPLEERNLLSAWTNQGQPNDVNHDLEVGLQDALVIVNHIHNEGSQLPDENPAAVAFYDPTNDGQATLHDILTIVRGMHRDTHVFVQLENDTAPGEETNYDWISQDVVLVGKASTGDGVASLEVRLNGDQEDPFVDITSHVQTDGSFQIDATLLEALNQSPLTDATYQLDVRLTDPHGCMDVLEDVTFTRDTVAPASPDSLMVAPESDSGVSSTDGVTNDVTPIITGVAETGSLVTVTVDDVVAGQVLATSPWQLELGPLTPGEHIVVAVAEDVAGNVSIPSSELHITIDVTSPPAPFVQLAPEYDSPPVGDYITNFANVTVQGNTEPYSTIELVGVAPSVIVSSDDVGYFSIANVALSAGENALDLHVQDPAGNLTAATTTITLDPSEHEEFELKTAESISDFDEDLLSPELLDLLVHDQLDLV